MTTTYAHLGAYSDLVTAANQSKALFPSAQPGEATRQAVIDMLNFEPFPPRPQEVRIDRRWQRDGIAGEAVSWSVGYGPPTEAWLLRPAGVEGKLPGVIALHDHGGFKYLGKEKIATGPEPPSDVQRQWMSRCYGGRPFADELARRGFAVLVPDVFTWGSRRFDQEIIPKSDRARAEALHEQSPKSTNPPHLMPESMSRYCYAAILHEHTLQKYCHVLGTTLSGIIAFEDRVAANYLQSREDVTDGGVGCVGLSGGGLRAGLLQATSLDMRASVVVGMMSTYESLLDHNVASHTWMLFPSPTWSHVGDWPDLVACRAPSPLMVQYDRHDDLFTMEGMQEADRRLAQHYAALDQPDRYVGQFYDGPHKFDRPMQESAFAWLKEQLAG